MLGIYKLHCIQIFLMYPFIIVCSRHDFLLFENFEITKKIFIEEQSVVPLLENVRLTLNQKREELRNLTSISKEQIDTSLQNIENNDHLFDFQVNMVLKFHGGHEVLPMLKLFDSRHRVIDFSYSYIS